jgi:hypothetical protein
MKKKSLRFKHGDGAAGSRHSRLPLRTSRSHINKIQFPHIFEIEFLLEISVKFFLLAPSAKGHAPCI